MVSGIKNIDRSYEDWKLPDSVCIMELEMIKNDAYHIYHVTKDKWRAPQATIDDQWCSIVYQWNRKWVYSINLDYLKIFGCICWSFGWWFYDNRVCLSRGLIKKTLWLACAFHAHQHALSINLALRHLTLFRSLTLTPMTPAFFGSKGTTRKAAKI